VRAGRTSGGPGIRLAVACDIEPLTTTLVAAFRNTPDAAWLIPDPTCRDRIYPQLATARLTPAINAGHVHTTDDRTALAIWEPPQTTAPDPGSALLRHHHARLDTHGEPAALIAISPESRNLYQRHHYTTTDTIQLPDGPTLWVMWRQPHPPPHHQRW
jgi:hypothetical protein